METKSTGDGNGAGASGGNIPLRIAAIGLAVLLLGGIAAGAIALSAGGAGNQGSSPVAAGSPTSGSDGSGAGAGPGSGAGGSGGQGAGGQGTPTPSGQPSVPSDPAAPGAGGDGGSGSESGDGSDAGSGTANPALAPVRVPLDCESLLPESVAEAITGADLVPAEYSSSDPLSYSDERTGALECAWAAPDAEDARSFTPVAHLTIVPAVSADDYRATSEGIDYGGSPTIPGRDDDSRLSCQPGVSFPVCGMVDLVGEYGVGFWMVPASLDLTEDDVAASVDLFSGIADAVAGAGPSGPLWQPTGPNIAGVASNADDLFCDDLIPSAELGTIIGDPTVSNYRVAEGEFRIASFRSNAQVGGYACGWSGRGAGIWASVLPGGAPYFAASAPLGGGEWHPAAGYPGESFVSDDGMQVAVLIDNAWFLVRVPETEVPHLPEIVSAVVSTVLNPS
ncbi:hypothetical protein [Herbiconiux solani]|uniref:hypothetical protein n=1 Tax=Herbiconiux solani TaxID=661329 RepID=UPI000825701D|nr:hypothetical protein [Herbiconiux solani]